MRWHCINIAMTGLRVDYLEISEVRLRYLTVSERGINTRNEFNWKLNDLSHIQEEVS
jgi:hypothetical protein